MSLLGQGNANVVSGADKLLGTFTRGAASGLFSGKGNNPTTSPPPNMLNADGSAKFSDNNTAWQDTGATGYQQGANTDIVMNPNGYSAGALAGQ
jgi:hypothetical protein